MHKGGTFDLEIIDIGPTAPSSITSNQVARGTLASVSNITAGVLGIDTFRLESGTGNGGGAQPTMIDNLTITRTEGLAVVGTETGTGLEMRYSEDRISRWGHPRPWVSSGEPGERANRLFDTEDRRDRLTASFHPDTS